MTRATGPETASAPRPAPVPAADSWARIAANPHRRYNPLRDDWVLVSAGRASRPWQGREETPPPSELPQYDPACYLCPGNARAGGARNPDYDATFVFTNDFSALNPEGPELAIEEGLLRAEGEAGTCRVICFSRRHDLTLARMGEAEVRRVIDLWADQTAELATQFEWVQVFENRGESMGASSPHPHGQIWAGTALPDEAAREDATQRAYLARHGNRLLLDYAHQESNGPRVVTEDDDWLVVVPFWATWPFETLVVAKRPCATLPDLDDSSRDALAGSLIRLLAGYDRLFARSFPYSMGWHQAPRSARDGGHWQLHAHFFPPLLQASVRKFMVGYELLAETQRDLTAEDAARRLRAAVAATEASTDRSS